MAELNAASSRQEVAGQKENPSTWVSLNIDGEDEEHANLDSNRKFCPCVAKYSKEFCERTSLHGMQYLAEDTRPLLERLCWTVIISVSIFGCMAVIMKQWHKWQTSPVIVTFSETSTPAWNIPFPAVTICSEIKFGQSVLNFTDLSRRYGEGNLTKEEAQLLDYTSLLCDVNPNYKGSEVMDERVMEHFINLAPPLEMLLQACIWRGHQVNCSEIFDRIITDEGVCYTFNILAADELFTADTIQRKLMSTRRPCKDWNAKSGYTKTQDLEDTYPLRTMSAGIKSGLTALFHSWDMESDPECTIPIKGFKMVLHSPTEFPQVKKQFFRVPSGRDVVVSVHPEIITTTETLQDYPPSLRQCFFESERQLRFYKIYTQEHCGMECMTNYTLKYCDCVEFYMPRTPGTPICGPSKANCSTDVQDDYNFDVENREYCNCLPSCTDTTYDVQISQSGYMWEKVSDDLKQTRLATFSVFLRDMQVITKKRSELYGVYDFLSNCGGLLGLFMGFSILSLAEIIYFATLRPYCNFRRSRQHFFSKRKD